jgi:hypothetical protein
MRIRGMMVAVAVVAILVFTSREVWHILVLRTEYRRRSNEHRLIASRYDADDPDPMIDPERNRVREYHEKKRQYHGDLEEKYGRAASRPWITIAPDPPPPME